MTESGRERAKMQAVHEYLYGHASVEDQFGQGFDKGWQAAFEAGRGQGLEAAANLADKMQFVAGDVLAKGHDHDAAAQHDTAMEIAEAIRELAGRGGWISVETKLPTPLEEVWIYYINRDGDGNQTDSWLEEDGRWAMGSAAGYKVTHWQPLPAPPDSGDAL